MAMGQRSRNYSLLLRAGALNHQSEISECELKMSTKLIAKMHLVGVVSVEKVRLLFSHQSKTAIVTPTKDHDFLGWCQYSRFDR